MGSFVRITGLIALVTALLVAGVTRGDLVELQGGDRFSGTIERLTTDTVVVVTSYAGTITVSRAAVVGLRTEAPVHAAMTNGERLTGKLVLTPGGILTLQTAPDRLRQTNAAALCMVWRAAAPDPMLPPAPPGAVWKHALAFDLLGKHGNAQSLQYGGGAESVLSDPATDLKLFIKGAYGKTDGSLSEDRLLGGFDWEHRFSGQHSWYVRDDVWKDDLQGVRWRNMLAGGYGYYLYKQDNRDLRTRAGVGHTYTTYTDQQRDKEASLSLDAGLRYREQLSAQAVWSTELACQPLLEDFSNYAVTHESKLSIPLAIPGLSQEFGVANQYGSQPSAGKQKLDTTYFTRTRLAW
jgi:putative salt-induced outer membrane protein YdiY